jgi:hypothetical protein
MHFISNAHEQNLIHLQTFLKVHPGALDFQAACYIIAHPDIYGSIDLLHFTINRPWIEQKSFDFPSLSSSFNKLARVAESFCRKDAHVSLQDSFLLDEEILKVIFEAIQIYRGTSS